MLTASLFLRAFRWRILLTAEGPPWTPPSAFLATSAGYFGNNFLPARAGELVRTFMISSRCRLNSAYVLATALSERVADAIALVVISSLVLLMLPAQPGWLANAARPFAILGLTGALMIALLPRMESVPTRRLLQSLCPYPTACASRSIHPDGVWTARDPRISRRQAPDGIPDTDHCDLVHGCGAGTVIGEARWGWRSRCREVLADCRTGTRERTAVHTGVPRGSGNLVAAQRADSSLLQPHGRDRLHSEWHRPSSPPSSACGDPWLSCNTGGCNHGKRQA